MIMLHFEARHSSPSVVFDIKHNIFSTASFSVCKWRAGLAPKSREQQIDRYDARRVIDRLKCFRCRYAEKLFDCIKISLLDSTF